MIFVVFLCLAGIGWLLANTISLKKSNDFDNKDLSKEKAFLDRLMANNHKLCDIRAHAYSRKPQVHSRVQRAMVYTMLKNGYLKYISQTQGYNENHIQILNDYLVEKMFTSIE